MANLVPSPQRINNNDKGWSVRTFLNGFLSILADAINKLYKESATKEDVEKLKLRYYETEAALKVDQPLPNIGDRALAGVPYPGKVWGCKTLGVWYNTGVSPTPEELNLAEYAKNESLTALEEKTLPINPRWVQGFYSTQDGQIISTGTSPNPLLYISFEKYNMIIGETLAINLNASFQYRVFQFDDQGAFLDYSDWFYADNTEYLITTHKVGIAIKANDGSELLIGNLKDVEFSIKYKNEEVAKIASEVSKNATDIVRLNNGITDYETHRDGQEEQSILLSPTWESGFWNNSGNTGSSASWIRAEIIISGYNKVDVQFACPVSYNAKSYFIDSNGIRVGEYIGSDLGGEFDIPQEAVKLRLSNRIAGDGSIEGIPNPTVSGIIKGVSRFATEEYVDKNKISVPNKFLHMSFDDIYKCMQSLITNETAYISIFDNDTFAWLREMHNRYGVVFTLYCYVDNMEGTYNIGNIPTKFAQNFIDNKDWLKLAFHAKQNRDYRNETAVAAKSDYDEFVNAIMSQIGDYTVIDRVIRGNFFHASLEVAQAWRDCSCGVLGFLGCDDWSYNAASRIQNYYLTDEQSKFLDKRDRFNDFENHLLFFKTDFRFEQVVQRWGNINNCIADYKSSNRANEAYDMIVFSHEDYINSTYKPMMEQFFFWAKNNGYRFDFPMNVILKN